MKSIKTPMIQIGKRHFHPKKIKIAIEGITSSIHAAFKWKISHAIEYEQEIAKIYVPVTFSRQSVINMHGKSATFLRYS